MPTRYYIRLPDGAAARGSDPALSFTAHGAAGVPLYLWYPAHGEARQLPQVLTPESLVELAKAG